MRLVEKRRVAVALVADVAATHETEQRFSLDAVRVRGHNDRGFCFLHARLGSLVFMIVTVIVRVAMFVSMTVRMAALCHCRRRQGDRARDDERPDRKTHESPLFRGFGPSPPLI
jgi:hypothetical protein